MSCMACKREMSKANGCTMKYVKTTNGKYFKRQKVGDEGWVEPGKRCPDCGAKYGYFHHMMCDVEQCPICGLQLLSCDCDIEYFTKTKNV